MKVDVRKSDGFAGQHMVVLPEPLRKAARAHPLLRGLHVTDAGYFPSAEGHLVERPTGAPTTLVIQCLRGTGWFTLDGERREMTQGHLAWLPAAQSHEYGATESEPWTIAWAHFSGAEVPAWRELLGTNRSGGGTLLKLPGDRLDEVGLDRVYAELERGFAPHHQVAAAAALRQSLSIAAQLDIEPRGARSADDRVVASIEMLRRDWMRPHRLEELATSAGVSITHYSGLFRRHTGFAPIDFLIRLRVQQSCRLLDTTAMSVSDIANRVGYEDPYYFTRCFRRVMGCAPRQYRRIQKG
jgi:AraC-like DNA-binding protein